MARMLWLMMTESNRKLMESPRVGLTISCSGLLTALSPCFRKAPVQSKAAEPGCLAFQDLAQSSSVESYDVFRRSVPL